LPWHHRRLSGHFHDPAWRPPDAAERGSAAGTGRCGMKGTTGTWKLKVGIVAAIGLLALFLAHPAIASATPRTPTCDGLQATIVGTSGNDVLNGT